MVEGGLFADLLLEREPRATYCIIRSPQTGPHKRFARCSIWGFCSVCRKAFPRRRADRREPAGGKALL